MYKIFFYEDRKGYSELREQIKELARRSQNSKDSRIQLRQITYVIGLLEERGTRLPESITKYIGNDIWELRPGDNRILYFYSKNDLFVLLHMFRKKTQKTPRLEIERARRERLDFQARMEEELYEKLG